jgi:dTMP kinase
MAVEVGEHAIPTVVTGRVVSLRGRLLTVEGLDGAGKTTLVSGLTAAFDERGVPVIVLREPGGVELSERVRALVQDPSIRCDARAEAMLYAAARAQLVSEVLVPALSTGAWVLLDRFVDSSLAYQGGGRGLGVEAIAELNRFGTGGLVPDRTLLLRIAPDTGRARLAGRGDAPDRLEAEGEAFFARIAAAYDALAAAEPDRIRVLDAALAPDDVLAAALHGLQDLLPAAET